MNSDKITTIAGTIVGLLVSLGVFTQEQGNVLVQAAGILAGIAIAVWGYHTNKGPKPAVPIPPANFSDSSADKP